MVLTLACTVPPPPAPPRTARPFAAVKSGGNGKEQRLLVRDVRRCREMHGSCARTQMRWSRQRPRQASVMALAMLRMICWERTGRRRDGGGRVKRG